MTRPKEPDIVSRSLARNRLGVPSVVFFGIAGAAPLTVILGAVTTIYAVIGSTAVPVSYFIAAGILMVFTVGFVAMSRHIVNSGAFYSYISHGLGRVAGVGAAFVALPAYAMMQIGLFGLFGVVGSGLLAAAGIHVGWFVCARVAWCVVAVLGLWWVDLRGKVLAVLLVAEIVVVLIYDIVMVANPAGGTVSFDTLSPARMLSPQAAAMLVLAIAGFVGFEATVVLSEEAKDPRRTVSRATHWGVLIAYAITGADPLVYLFAWLTVLGGLGVLILMWSASAAVLAFFLRHRSKENAWRGQIAPGIAFLLLSGVLAATLIGLPDMLQVAPNSPLRWLIPPAYGVIALLGLGWGLITRVARPDVYAAIGRGTEGHLVAPVSPAPRRLSVEPVGARSPFSSAVH